MSLDDNTTDSGLSSLFENESVVAEQESESSPTAEISPALEDCICPICLDYFIDVVETNCQHRFCNFCLDNWLRVSLRQQCPTCRRNVGHIQSLPRLQESIRLRIDAELSDDRLQERSQVRTDRQILLDQAEGERQQNQSLLARITASRNRARLRRDADNRNDITASTDILSRHILNWWDDNQAPENPRELSLANNLHVDEEIEIEELPSGWFRRRHFSRGNNNDASRQSNTLNYRPAPTPVSTPSRSSTGPGMILSQSATGRTSPLFEQHRTLMSELEQVVYQDNLMEEYNYHLRRVNSAYQRIREGYRDFNYHNGRMQRVMEEYRTHFARARQESGENGSWDYDDFEDLIRAEIGELVDNSPAARVLSGVAPEDVLNNGFRRLQNGLRATLAGRSQNTHRVQNESTFDSHRRAPIFGDTTSPTNVLDMEQEIQTRRNQLDGIASRLQQFRTSVQSSGTAASPSSFPRNSPSAGISNIRNNVREVINRRAELLRPTRGQHHDRESSNSTLGSISRMRRRPGIMDILRHNAINEHAGPYNHLQTVRETTTHESRNRNSSSIGESIRGGIFAEASVNAERVDSFLSTANPGSSGPTQEDGSASPTILVSSHSSRGGRNQRRTITARRRLPGLANSSSESEGENGTDDNYRRFSTRIRRMHQSTSSSAAERPFSAPEDENTRRTLRFLQRPQNVSNNLGALAVSSTPSSSTRLIGPCPQNLRNRNQAGVASGVARLAVIPNALLDNVGDSLETDGVIASLGEDRERNNGITYTMSNAASVQDRFKAICDKINSRRPPPEP